MADAALHERLRQARAASGEELNAFSRRTGIRVHHLLAIEDGRFTDLPPGIYARATVRSFAEACRLDPDAVLAECEALLPAVTDPISALARKCGVRQTPVAATAESIESAVPRESARAEWRTSAAAAVDAVFVGVLLMMVVASIAMLARVPVASLAPSATPLALVGVVLGSGYFVWFGGLCGRTLGGLAVRAPASDRTPLILRAIAIRAILAATDDAHAIVGLGRQVAQWRVRPGAPSRSAPPPALELWPLRRRGRAPVLWSPASRPGAAPHQTLPQPRG